MNERISKLMDASNPRFETVSSIYELLQANSEKLKNAGITKVLLFGSVFKGTARGDSDIDICVIHTPIDMEDFNQFAEVERRMEAGVLQALQNAKKDVSFKPAQNGQNTDIIHITMVPNDTEDPNFKPPFATESVTLWQSEE